VGVVVELVGAEGLAKLVDGLLAPGCAGKGAINPSWLPPMCRCGWEGAGNNNVVIEEPEMGDLPSLRMALPPRDDRVRVPSTLHVSLPYVVVGGGEWLLAP
jgi:hypothetical protein